MISSKALLDQTGMSRATLNNYIALGILPKPVVLSQTEDASAGANRLLGYFPLDAIDRVRAVQSLKSEGLSIAEIAEYIKENGIEPEATLDPEQETLVLSNQEHERSQAEELAKNQTVKILRETSAMSAKVSSDIPQMPKMPAMSGLPSLSLDSHGHPAYMLNYNLELTWLNEAARAEIFGFAKPPAHSVERNLFFLLARPEAKVSLADQRSLASMHLQIASERIGREALLYLVSKNDPAILEMVDEIDFPQRSDQNASPKIFGESDFYKTSSDGRPVGYRVFSVYFREGILVVHTPMAERGDELIEFLSRRDQVIQKLLSQQLPVMTPLAVLVADIQSSVRICSELPPDEYFELINQIWHTMSQVLRKYKGAHGKHAGDGAVYYFFPQPDGNYLFNSLACADELRAAMMKINVEWQIRKNWLTELKLNIGLHEGQEWLGTFRSDHHVEFMVLGDTINHAARLSDFATHGTIWATKNLVSRLTADERRNVEFGVLRRSQENGDRFVESSYAQIDSLVALDDHKFDKLRDIAKLAVTEIRRVHTKRA